MRAGKKGVSDVFLHATLRGHPRHQQRWNRSSTGNRQLKLQTTASVPNGDLVVPRGARLQITHRSAPARETSKQSATPMLLGRPSSRRAQGDRQATGDNTPQVPQPAQRCRTVTLVPRGARPSNPASQCPCNRNIGAVQSATPISRRRPSSRRARATNYKAGVGGACEQRQRASG